MSLAPRVVVVEQTSGLVIQAEGDWVVWRAAELNRRLRALLLPSGRPVEIDLRHLRRLDAAGAWLLLRTESALTLRGNRVTLTGLQPSLTPLLDQLRAHRELFAQLHTARRRHPLLGLLAPVFGIIAALGARGARLLGHSVRMVAFGGLVSVISWQLLLRPGRLGRVAIATLVETRRILFGAMPMVGLVSLLFGIVFAHLAANQLRQFGAEILTIDLLGIAVLRELGAVLSAIIIAVRYGGSFTAEIGTMQVNQEIDALRTLGLDPIEELVLPRLFALVVALTLLVVWADAMALGGGWLATRSASGTPLPAFFDQLAGAITPWTFWVGLSKAPMFAVLIAIVSAFEGLNVRNSADSVGRQTTRSAVESVFLVIVADAGFAGLFQTMRI